MAGAQPEMRGCVRPRHGSGDQRQPEAETISLRLETPRPEGFHRGDVDASRDSAGPKSAKQFSGINPILGQKRISGAADSD